ncbi:MAG: BadF/BadG/BcrA/BcrD ATPase family protein, partial [Coriobacteriales bacterium]
GQLEERCAGQLLELGFTGSGALGLARELGLPHVQEVVAARSGVQAQGVRADAFIELGGEDAKLVYLAPPVEQRMNTSCASGTGSFLEDVAQLMGVGMGQLDELAAAGSPRFAIASRCAVFAARDLKPLLAAGEPRCDVAASVFQAVVDQTLGTLACGRPVEGTVLFLGGPMEHLPALVERFCSSLGLAPGRGVKPANAQLMPAWGAAQEAASRGAGPQDVGELLERVRACALQAPAEAAVHEPPLCALREALVPGVDEQLERVPLGEAAAPLYLGVDAGSTTLKIAAIDARGRLCHSAYEPAPAQMREAASGMLAELRAAWAAAHGGAELPVGRMLACGYGEEVLREALGADSVIAETAAHLEGALALFPQASFVLDIGGQDMKALWVQGGQLDRTAVNETCSSGCGAFMSSAAASLGLGMQELDAAALAARDPVDLGARCTVFMRSRVRAAQEQGASVADIAAGAAHAVARNALRRLIGPKRLGTLGEHVVVQGGAFASDAVLCAFAQELGRPVLRSSLAPLAGALGAACAARRQALQGQAARPREEAPNVIAFQQRLLCSYRSFSGTGPRGQCTVGFVPALNCYEALPFWHRLLRELGFSVLLPVDCAGFEPTQTQVSATLPSDTVCLPAQLTHRMCLQLAAGGASCLLAPSFERAFHCAVSSEYALVLEDALAPVLGGVPVYAPNVLSFAPKRFMKKDEAKQALFAFLQGLSPAEQPLEWAEYAAALEAAWEEQQAFTAQVEEAGARALEWVHAHPERHGVIACGRSYHTAPQLLNGLDELLAEQGFAVIAPIAVDKQARSARGPLVDKRHNESIEAVWRAAKHFLGYAALAVQDEQLELVCLQSFGCGMDAVSLADVERLLEEHGKPFTLIKLDSKCDPAHTRIRLRALADSVRSRKRSGMQAPQLDAESLLGGVSRSQDLAFKTDEYERLFASVLPFEGLCAEDVDYAVRKVPADMCGTAALLAAYAIRRAGQHPAAQIELPDCCELCLTNAVQHLMLMEGLVNPVCWSAAPQSLPYELAQLGAASARAPQQLADRAARVGEGSAGSEQRARRVGIAGNPLLLFDNYANQGLADAVLEHGFELCLPAPDSWFSDPQHYLPQLQSLYEQGVRQVLWLQSFCCLKAHVHVHGALPSLRRRFPGMELSVIELDPQASPLNAHNRLLLALESQRIHDHGGQLPPVADPRRGVLQHRRARALR